MSVNNTNDTNDRDSAAPDEPLEGAATENTEQPRDDAPPENGAQGNAAPRERVDGPGQDADHAEAPSQPEPKKADQTKNARRPHAQDSIPTGEDTFAQLAAINQGLVLGVFTPAMANAMSKIALATHELRQTKGGKPLDLERIRELYRQDPATLHVISPFLSPEIKRSIIEQANDTEE